MRTKRWKHGCFSIEEKGTVTKVVAMGGKDRRWYGNPLATAEILDVTSMQWQNLPDLPFGVGGNKGLKSLIGPYLGFSVGGKNGQEIRQQFEQRIIGLRKNENGDYYWKEVNGLTTGRYLTSVVNAPMSMVPC